MNKIRNYGPSFTLLAVVILVMLGGPYMLRQLAFAEQEGRIESASKNLHKSKLAELSESFKLIAERVEPSVVHITIKKKNDGNTYYERRFGQRNLRPREENQQYNDPPSTAGSGSGWIYDKQGHIITNYHVVRNAFEIQVKFFNKTTRLAKVVGFDEKTDIAVLKVKANHLHPAKISDNKVAQGEIVFAFGSPFRFDFSMSQGIISGQGRHLGILETVGGYENFIQTDAAINPGNSGGPLTNIYGEVVGMNTAIASKVDQKNGRGVGLGLGLGFAIPADMLKHYIPQLIKKGIAQRGYLGVIISDNPQLLKTFDVDKGVLIDDVMQGTPAAKAGIKRGDIILKLDNNDTADSSELRRYVARQSPGTPMKVKLLRNGKQLNLTVTLDELPSNRMLSRRPQKQDTPTAKTDGNILKKLGIEKVETVTRSLTKQAGIPFVSGILVKDIRHGSVAHVTANIIPGMIISEVQNKPVSNEKELIAELGKHDLAKGVRVTILSYINGRYMSKFALFKLEQ